MRRTLPLLLGVVALGVLGIWLARVGPPVDSQQFSDDQVRTLNSLEKLSDHPLYVMHYYGSYRDVTYSTVSDRSADPAWGCTLFAAMADPETPVYGRNFDWPRHPALVLIADPPDAYASVSMVDLSFILPENVAQEVHLLPPEQLSLLLETPLWTFDGMNECGLAIGMAAVADAELPHDKNLQTVASLEVMRWVLDSAATVAEAIDIFERVNVVMAGGPCLHYLVADGAGGSALIEYWEGRMHVLRSEDSWACATNYRLCRVDEADRPGTCWRYDAVHAELSRTSGSLHMTSAMALLDAAHYEVPEEPEAGTQWSVVYDMRTGRVELAMGHDYDKVFEFQVPADSAGNDSE